MVTNVNKDYSHLWSSIIINGLIHEGRLAAVPLYNY